jgi:hypothetical protein
MRRLCLGNHTHCQQNIRTWHWHLAAGESIIQMYRYSIYNNFKSIQLRSHTHIVGYPRLISMWHNMLNVNCSAVGIRRSHIPWLKRFLLTPTLHVISWSQKYTSAVTQILLLSSHLRFNINLTDLTKHQSHEHLLSRK